MKINHSYLITETPNLLYICVKGNTPEENIGWETLQNIKDKHFSDKDFFEIFPPKKSVINRANERHLWHMKDGSTPKPRFEDLEWKDNTKITFYEKN